MNTYEGVTIICDPHGSATARSVNLVTDRLQSKSIRDNKTFKEQCLSEWDAEADCEQIFKAIEKSHERKGETRYASPYSGNDTRSDRPSPARDMQPSTPVDKTPTTIAELMGWDESHVPAEQTASPIVPAGQRPEPRHAAKPEPVAQEPEPEEPFDIPAPAVNPDVFVDFGEDDDDEPDMAIEVLRRQERALQDLNGFVERSIESLQVCAPRAMTMEMLVTMAKNEWFLRRIEKEPDVDRSTLRLPQDDFARKNIVVNFVKHELVFPRYDDVVDRINSYDQMVSQADIERCYGRWRFAVIDALSEAFPLLATTANAQRIRRYDARQGKLVSFA